MNYIDEIYKQLEYISQKDRTITVITRFKGVSFSIVGKVAEISQNRDWVKITTHPTQNLSLLPSSQVELHNELFTYPIQSRVKSVDLGQRTAVLDSLNYVFEERGNRKYHRVEPEEALEAVIFSKESKKYPAQISDISLHGLSLSLSSAGDFENVFEQGNSVRVEFSLPNMDRLEDFPISFMSKIIYINPLEGKGNYRVGLKTWADDEERDTIRQYIFDRQTQIVKQFSK